MKVLAIKNRGHGAQEVIFDEQDDVYFRPGQLEALTAYLTRPQPPPPLVRAQWLSRYLRLPFYVEGVGDSVITVLAQAFRDAIEARQIGDDSPIAHG